MAAYAIDRFTFRFKKLVVARSVRFHTSHEWCVPC
jgi:hypothetical protein